MVENGQQFDSLKKVRLQTNHQGVTSTLKEEKLIFTLTRRKIVQIKVNIYKNLHRRFNKRVRR